ncbi:MAG TPA: hypothetical protein VLA16_20850 [Ideonella sp.]|nr:hypothetical protein [Ideonella sp.]
MFLKLGTAFCAVAASSLLAGTSACAHDQSGATAPATPSAVEGLRVGIDPATRQLRAVTAAEAKALDALGAGLPASRRVASQAIASRTTGARGVRLGSEHLAFARAERQADGSVAVDCVEGSDGLASTQRAGAELE